jgi:hypothetical protein
MLAESSRRSFRWSRTQLAPDPTFCAGARRARRRRRPQVPGTAPDRAGFTGPAPARRAGAHEPSQRGRSLRSSRRARGACVPAGSRRRAWRRHARGVWARQVGWINAQGLRVVSNVARNALILLDTRRRRSRGEQRGGAASYARYRTLQTPEIQLSSRGREHRRDRGAECGSRPFSRSAHRRSVRAACGSAAGALAGRLRRRRAARRSSHAVARRARASLPASPRPSRRFARVKPARESEPFVAAGA